MTAHDPELDQLLDEPLGDRPPPMLVPWGWRIFFALLIGLDIVCLLVGRVPWSGAPHGLDRVDVLLILVVGTALGLGTAVAAETIAASRAATLGLTAEEARLAADELSILTRPLRAGRASIVPLVALVWIVCTLLARFVFRGASLPAATVFIALHSLAGLALPVLWRSYQQAHEDFQLWLDEKNAPFDPLAAERVAAHRAHTDGLHGRVRAAEDELKERLDRMPRVAPPVYLVPWAMVVPPALALVLDLILLFSPGAREAVLGVNAGVGKLVWSTLGLWIESCVLIGVLYAVLAWYYASIADQVSRQWPGRDWSGGLGAVAIEVLYGSLLLAVLLSLILGGHARFVMWNVAAATPLLIGVLADIRNTAAQHHQRSVEQRAGDAGPPPPKRKPKSRPKPEPEADEDPL
jgi:hypothetical protein